MTGELAKPVGYVWVDAKDYNCPNSYHSVLRWAPMAWLGQDRIRDILCLYLGLATIFDDDTLLQLQFRKIDIMINKVFKTPEGLSRCSTRDFLLFYIYISRPNLEKLAEFKSGVSRGVPDGKSLLDRLRKPRDVFQSDHWPFGALSGGYLPDSSGSAVAGWTGGSCLDHLGGVAAVLGSSVCAFESPLRPTIIYRIGFVFNTITPDRYIIKQLNYEMATLAQA
ncbi:hypothetical protein WA026_022046 [Henosepilachna vigintioctopunctata]|uniref:Uncharacterized protein n=1 Tax=Henosepilachna vigintioctopunctata TaxID=420089 RepID=A0AAW1U755_9CUCU